VFNLNGTSFPSVIGNLFTTSYEQFDGGISTLEDDIEGLILDVITDQIPELAEDTTIKYFGSIPKEDYELLEVAYTASTNVFGVDNVSFEDSNPSSGLNDSWYYALFENIGNSQYSGFSFFTTITGVTLTNPITTTTTTAPITTTTTTNPCVTPTPITTTTTTAPVIVNCYTGTIVGKVYYYTGTSYTQYDDLIVCTLRS